MSTQIYLVVEPISIIAADLALSIQDFDPAARVSIAASHAAALLAIEAQTSVRAAFVHADPAGFAETPLGLALAKRGAETIFMGNAAERPGVEARVLLRPFSAETTAAQLRHLTNSVGQ